MESTSADDDFVEPRPALELHPGGPGSVDRPDSALVAGRWVEGAATDPRPDPGNRTKTTPDDARWRLTSADSGCDYLATTAPVSPGERPRSWPVTLRGMPASANSGTQVAEAIARSVQRHGVEPG